MPEPRHEPFQALQVERCQRAAANARVALSGDGGDDVLLGPGLAVSTFSIEKREVGFGIRGRDASRLERTQSTSSRIGIRSRILNRIGRARGAETFSGMDNPRFCTEAQSARPF